MTHAPQARLSSAVSQTPSVLFPSAPAAASVRSGLHGARARRRQGCVTLPSPDGGLPTSEGSLVEAARSLAPRIRAAAAEIERDRRIPSDLIRALEEAGVFRMVMPRAWGGPEADILTQIDVVEQLSMADGSVGWCATIGLDCGYFSAFLDDHVGRALYPDLDPSESWDVVDTWTTTGLRGSGSHDIVVDGTFVPAERTFNLRESPTLRYGPLYAYRNAFVANVVGVPLGIARAAVDVVVALAETKRTRAGGGLRDEPYVQTAVARADALVSAARGYAFDTIGDV